MLTIGAPEALALNICQYCKLKADGEMICNYGVDFAHKKCYYKYFKEGRKMICNVCNKEIDDNNYMTIDKGKFIHTECHKIKTCSICNKDIKDDDYIVEETGKYIHIKCEVTKFESGAIRSTDANATDYWLITPIGLKRLVEQCGIIKVADDKEINEKNYYIDAFFESVYTYLSGARDNDYLAIAASAVCELICIETGKFHLTRTTNNDFTSYNIIPPIALEQLAQTYNEGKIKYSAYNCEKGFPIHDLTNHAIKHINDWRSGQSKEANDLPHALWNMLMAIHSEELWPDLNKPYLRGPNCSLTEDILKMLMK